VRISTRHFVRFSTRWCACGRDAMKLWRRAGGEPAAGCERGARLDKCCGAGQAGWWVFGIAGALGVVFVDGVEVVGFGCVVVLGHAGFLFPGGSG
jgi:hypothetical protein